MTLTIIEKQKGSQEIYEYVIFPLLVILFSIYFDALKNVILKDKIVEKELYEISLDIYDQLCLEQDEDQDKRELKDYIERKFLNKV